MLLSRAIREFQALQEARGDRLIMFNDGDKYFPLIPEMLSVQPVGSRSEFVQIDLTTFESDS